MFDLIWQDARKWAETVPAGPIPTPPADRAVESASLLLWGEHCVECVAPQCYSSCSLYVRRRDGRCARFAYGIHPNRSVQGLFDFGADIDFRRWAKLEARWTGRPALFPVRGLRRRGAIVRALGRGVLGLQKLMRPVDPNHRLSRRFAGLVRSWQKRRFRGDDASPVPDALYIKCWHAGTSSHRMDFEIAVDHQTVFRRSFPIRPGWNEHVLPFGEIPARPDQRGHIRFWIEGDEKVRLVFTWLDFVTFAAVPAASAAPAPKVKCVAWDLDQTVWEGILAEGGPERLRLKPEIAELVRRLDEKGILQTVASKNDFDPAWKVVEKSGLAEYFLFPAIHWGPKSGSLKQIAAQLNIDVNSFAFIDDAPFERAEVASAVPQVRVFDPATMGDLLARPEFDVPVTAESRSRRLKYVDESKRLRIAATWGADHEGFLLDCRMAMAVSPPAAAEKIRCHELLERTNQFNLSGRRYTLGQLESLLQEDRVEALAIRVQDRFGDYGLVGFALFERAGECVTLFEFVLSCRVANKTVEDTFFLWYAARARERGAKKFRIRFNETTRNTPLKEALGRLPARTVSESGASRELEMSLEEAVPVPTIVRIEEPAISTTRTGS